MSSWCRQQTNSLLDLLSGMRYELPCTAWRSPSCNDDTADYVGPSVPAPGVPPLGIHIYRLRRCESPRSGLRRAAVKSLAAPLRYKAAFDVSSHVWSSSGWWWWWWCLLCGGYILSPNQPLLPLSHGFLFWVSSSISKPQESAEQKKLTVSANTTRMFCFAAIQTLLFTS